MRLVPELKHFITLGYLYKSRLIPPSSSLPWFQWMCEAGGKFAEIADIGLIKASAIVTAMCTAHEFKNGHRLAVWIKLVPKQNSSNLFLLSKSSIKSLAKVGIHIWAKGRAARYAPLVCIRKTIRYRLQ